MAPVVYNDAATIFAAICACIFTVVGILGKHIQYLHNFKLYFIKCILCP